MSTFTMPVSSSPPSTPGGRAGHGSNQRPSFPTFAPNPSTTPAGPPPSSARSFTPAGPPPSSVFGSSRLDPGNALFQTKPRLGHSMGSQRSRNSPSFKPVQTRKPSHTLFKSSPRSRIGSDRRGNTFTVPGSSLQSSLVSDVEMGSEDDMNGDDEDLDQDEGFEEEGSMEVDSDAENQLPEPSFIESPQQGSVRASGTYNWAQHGSSVSGRSLYNARSPQAPQGRASTTPKPIRQDALALVKKKDSAIPTLVRDCARQIGPPNLSEPDKLILETDASVSQLYQSETNYEEQEQLLEAALVSVPAALKKLWQFCCNEEKNDSPSEGASMIGIGPREYESSLQKATFLGTLLLDLHHPPAVKGRQAFAASQPSRASFRSSFSNSVQAPLKLAPYPHVLLDWLAVHHDPYRSAIKDLNAYHPGSTAHKNFWDIIFCSTMRGKFTDVIQVLKDADFGHAKTAREDGQLRDGYHGAQLDSINRVVHLAIELLESSPIAQDGDWDVIGGDWRIFRKRVEQALSDLISYAEGRDRDLDPSESTFEAENFGIRTTPTALSRSARRAESRVPWTVYQNLKAVYGILLGGTTEIITLAQDWVEATIALTAWWDGSDNEEIAVGNLAMTRQSLRHSQGHARSVDLNPGAAYLRRLAYAFEKVTDDSKEDPNEEPFKINPLNPVEVGLAAIFEGDVEGVLELLRSWSMPITTAIIEIASQANWFEPAAGTALLDGFDESDLLVLSYGQPANGLTRDGVLVEYAEMLFTRDVLKDKQSGVSKEGWELSMELLTRLNDTTLANRQVGEFLGRLSLHSDHRADKMIGICRAFGLDREASNIAERYGDFVVDETDRYGTATIYYARAHKAKKVKDVLDLLISLCLVQSIAFPPLSKLDSHLRDLVSSPRESLTTLAKLDDAAANLLKQYLSGYATLRKFYDLRDEEANLGPNQKPSLRPIARRKAAATALLAVIASAADNIHGGLYDEQRGAVVQVDGLLALLGEATVFVDQPTRILTLPQILLLLKAIEDLQTVTSRIYSQCEDCFQATLAAARGIKQAASPKDLLKKSISSLTASSGFSLVGSSMMDEDGAEDESDVGMNGNGNRKQREEVGKEKRGWDWRTGMRKGATGDDVLRLLRLGLAKEVARAWVDGEDTS